MIDFLLNLVTDMPGWAILLSKVTVILAVAAIGHGALTSANPRWRVFLWRITAVSLIVVTVLAVAAPRFSWRVHVAPRVVPNHMPPYAASKVPLLKNHSPSVDGGITHEATAKASLQPTASATPIHLPRHSVTPTAIEEVSTAVSTQWVLPTVACVWLAGMFFRGLRLCTGSVRIRRMVRLSREVSETIRNECREVAQSIRCHRPVSVLQSNQISSPLVCGLRTSMLLLPQKMCTDSYRHERPGIFAHELAHVRSFDIVWNDLLEILSIVLWFHPLAWRMRKWHLDACELVCDSVSAAYVGSVSDYCRTLARVATEINAAIPSVGIAMARTSFVTRRVRQLSERFFPRPLRRRNVIALGVATLMAVAFLGAMHLTQAAPTDAPKDKTSAKETTPESPSVRVRIFDPDGKPLPGARVHASIWTEEKGFKSNRDYTTDGEGFVGVELPRSYTIVRLWSSKKPYVTMFSHWEQNELASGKTVPPEYSVYLERAVTAGGRVVDERGQPIAGAKIQVSTKGGRPVKADRRTIYDTWLASGKDTATTDADGKWQIDNVPTNPKATLSLLVTHPDYRSDDTWGASQKASGVTSKMLRQGVATVTLKDGNIVKGRVTDPANQPIKGAVVVLGDDPYFSNVPMKFSTNADGQFRLPAQPSGMTSLTVIAPGFAPQLRRIEMTKDLPPQDFQMAPGKLAELRFVDASGKPIPNVSANLVRWKGSKSVYYETNPNHPKVPDTKIPNKADANGVWSWDSAPDDPVTLQVYAKGLAAIDVSIAGGDPPKTVTLRSEHRIVGLVTDAESKQAIPLFTIIPVDVFRPDWLNAERGNAKTGKDGKLDYLATRTDIPLRLRIEAPGYRTQTGPEFRVGDDSPRTQDFALQPSKPVSGQVTDTSGKPVAKADVLLATPTAGAEMKPDAWGNYTSTTDANGRFAFADPGEPFTLIAQADAGVVMADFPLESHDVGTLRLQPWASIRGRFREGDKPVPHVSIFAQPVRLDNLTLPKVEARLDADTDAQGKFQFLRVPPGPVSVRVYGSWPWKEETFRSAPSVPLDLEPGKHAELDLGGQGTTLTGKVKLTGSIPPGLDCHWSINYLIRREPGIHPPSSIAKFGFDAGNGWRPTWLSTSEGRAYLETLHYWHVKLEPDGAFRMGGVPEGEYDFVVSVYAKPEGCMVDPLAQTIERVTVTAADVQGGELKVPDISAPVVAVPGIGDAPAFTFEHADGSQGTLEQFKGQYLVVDFWASWCGPCKQQIPALQKLHDELVSTPRVAMVGISLDDDTAAWHSALKDEELPWKQGRITGEASAGVSSVPAYWLLDPTGKIVLKSSGIEELRQRLKEIRK
jgi:beta-lactamase regulating signal transducer with metallopeptidase domain/protocatechuate 3,4-dioxygenase beta subunit/thiol-disulfide isomerase/thioredoxin